MAEITFHYFDEAMASAVCAEYLAAAHAVHKAEMQADIDGFWRVIRSEQAKALRIRTLEHQAAPAAATIYPLQQEHLGPPSKLPPNLAAEDPFEL